ncbi:1-deoxy-D-xylulose 5-phosphate reductoisomerase [Melghirimyces thermohalophilus]|uniref:1-deoxy-D-xylulose 5-phosphate reductoisomerase n=1 Tax=Melghirimyces thermohalophilus TaxID=1236220 RepID=A0A1G6J1E0_9BACL|nr:1-deoxy-D-xylulose-5-phosphate reductoisomerase [Melghirimyces thermohalophilus]SDC12135.1 1-deoxy-D-xylulose 5-phosphate reductoisomerase [Melghirimyces thermohalophilus]
MQQRLAILGSTGSVGTNTLEIVRQHPDRFEVVALAAGSNVDEMVSQVEEFHPSLISMSTKEAAQEVKRRASHPVRAVFGPEGMEEVAAHPDATYLVSALVGSQGLPPTLTGIRAGKTVGLANKETLVMGGSIVMGEAKAKGVDVLPIDSEHSAIFQSLNGEKVSQVRRIILTASGGAFRDWTREKMNKATREEALNHPNWSMGAKVTVDSASMMNKGLEVIEARWLFDLPYDQIDVLVHEESIIHSMVEFVDGAVMAQLGTPDMKVPIQYALSYPGRLPLEGKPLDLAQLGTLHFRQPDLEQFPCLGFSYQAGRQGGTATTVLNAANEVAVEKFLEGGLPFLMIEEIIGEVLSRHQTVPEPGLEDLFEADRWARRTARLQLEKAL